MTHIRSLVNLSLTIALVVGVAGRLHSAEPEQPVKITLHPAAEPTPALKYRLLPGRLDQIHGNAAVYYGKVTAEETNFFGNRELRENIGRWQEMPLEQLRLDKVHLPSSGGIEFSIRRGARCKDCDWQLPIGDVPYSGMLLPEVQQIREFGRILAARARLQMADGDFSESVETLQAGYALGRHVATGETIVNGLVGNVICELMSYQIIDFVQQPEAPNLYWALSTLPTPLIEMRDAMDVEAMGLELSFPELKDIKTTDRTPDQWRELFHRFARDVVDKTYWDDLPQPPSPEQLDELCQRKLPAAKQALIADDLPADEVDAMSIHQVALLYSLLTYHKLFDDAAKYYYLPYPQAKAGIEGVIERAKHDEREIIPIAERLLPGIQGSRSAIARTDRQIAVLRLFEALRIHAASHDGKLPERLADITEVPIPDDPVTGLPFDYRRDGDQAILSGPTHGEVPLNYEITMLPAP